MSTMDLNPYAPPFIEVILIGGPLDGVRYPDVPHRMLPLRYEIPYSVGTTMVYARDTSSQQDGQATYRIDHLEERA